MLIHYAVSNNGDGSYSVYFFDDPETIEALQDEDPDGWPSESEGCFEAIGFSEKIWSRQEAFDAFIRGY